MKNYFKNLLYMDEGFYFRLIKISQSKLNNTDNGNFKIISINKIIKKSIFNIHNTNVSIEFIKRAISKY